MAKHSFDHLPPSANTKRASNQAAANGSDKTQRTDPYAGIDPELIPYLQAAAEDDTDGDLESVALDNEPDTNAPDGGAERPSDQKDAQDLQALTSQWLGDDQLLEQLLSDQKHTEEQAQDSVGYQSPTEQRPVSTLSPARSNNGSASSEVADPALWCRYRQIYEALASRRAEHQINPALDKVETVLDIVGSPQHLYPSIHVTGTNGKTSTARMIETLARTLGYRTGRYTSPHLSQVTERIVIDGQDLSVSQFLAAWDDIAPYIGMYEEKTGSSLSFFEALTVMALAYFADVPVNVAIVEVGMGGRWDATNVINASVSVLMPISREHEQWLGRGIENIATEKAGIIKPGATVVSAIQEEAAAQIIAQVAAQNDAVLRVEGTDFRVEARRRAVGGQLLDIATPSATYRDIFLPLYGVHQAQNAACALVAMEAHLGGIALDGPSVEKAFAQVSSPGRLETVRSSPMTVIDAGHNPGAMPALGAALEEDLAWNYTVGVFSALDDKDVETMLGIMEPYLDELIITQIDSPRAAQVEQLAQVAQEVFGEERVRVEPDLGQALEEAVEILDRRQSPAGTEGILVFGSVVLAGMARDLLGHSRS